jgi:hypothetical protein
LGGILSAESIHAVNVVTDVAAAADKVIGLAGKHFGI